MIIETGSTANATGRRARKMFKLGLALAVIAFGSIWVGYWLHQRSLQIGAWLLGIVAVACWWVGVALSTRANFQAEREREDELFRHL